MSYFIFQKNKEGIENTFSHKMCENSNELNNFNLILTDYKIIEESQENFTSVRLGTKYPLKYNNNLITFIDELTVYNQKKFLDPYIEKFKLKIQNFLNNNDNHIFFNKWNNYLTQLNNLDTNSITFPIKSLEQYFFDKGNQALSIYEVP